MNITDWISIVLLAAFALSLSIWVTRDFIAFRAECRRDQLRQWRRRNRRRLSL